jgi:hypothetical protein
MPWTPRQVRFLESSGSPLTGAQKAKMNAELHADPSLGHKKKGSEAMKNNIREMRIEIHRGKGGAVSGHTVHHDMMPTKTKSPAFMENTRESYPFDAKGMSQTHGSMLNHIGKHLGMGAATEEEHAMDGAENDEEEAG